MNIQELQDKYLKLSKVTYLSTGLKSLCPFHNDNQPSFFINIKKGIVKCFGCSKFMPLFDFLVLNDVPYEIAVEYIVLYYGKVEEKKVVYDDFMLGRKLPKSLLDRGFCEQVLRRFNVGYDELNKCITIPMYFNNILLGVKYRKYPKIFWYSDNFSKESFIYNYQPEKSEVFIVEGETDTWRSVQYGVENIEAILGNVATEAQLKLFKRHQTINIALDNDLAGLKGSFFLERCLKNFCRVNFTLYNGKDVGETKEESWNTKKIIPFVEFELNLMQKNKKVYDEIILWLKSKNL